MASILESSMNSSSPLMITNHPFYPLEVEIAAYLANEWTMQVLLSVFVGLILTIVMGTKMWVERVHPNLPGREQAAIWWFVICRYFLLLLPISTRLLLWEIMPECNLGKGPIDKSGRDLVKIIRQKAN
jgi:membrane protein YdbS with pleckstrin-like domain